MQSYLGNYPGSRTNAGDKLIRCINSFLAQNYSNCELIIIADGCTQTKSIYNQYYKDYVSVRMAYIEQETSVMYSKSENKTFYRGYPRQIGMDMASGDVITYIDSDDYLMPDAALKLQQIWQLSIKNNIKVILNNSWYDNYVATYESYDWYKCVDKNVQISDLPSYWNNIQGVDRTIMLLSPWALSHTKNISVKWEDIFSTKTSEDVYFINKLFNTYPKHQKSIISIPYYVRCHYRGLWDV